MKTRFTYIVILALGLTGPLMAQEADSLMRLVLENNRQLKSAREAAQTAILRAGTGNTPSDPTVEFGYLYGDPAAIGNKINIMVKQEVDFPTAYLHRSKLRDLRTSRAELEYQMVRQEVLSKARCLWIEALHLQLLEELLSERLRRAETIRDQVRLMMDAGEVGALEFSQASLVLASIESEYAAYITRIENNRLALEEVTGKSELEINSFSIPDPLSFNPDTLLDAYRLGPGARLYEFDRLEKDREEKLMQSQRLPKLSAGYFSEAVETEAFRGFTLGFSLPLWENTRRVKTARSAVLHSEAELDRFLARQEREVRQKLSELENLTSRVEKLEEALGSANTPELLTSSVESGEISLAEYFYTSDFYFRNQQLLLRYRRDLLVLEAELLKIWY